LGLDGVSVAACVLEGYCCIVLLLTAFFNSMCQVIVKV